MDETLRMQSAEHCRYLRARRRLGCRGFLASLLEVGVRARSPEVVWDLHRTRRAHSLARKFNRNCVPIPKLRRGWFVRWAMLCQVVERVTQQGLVFRADFGPVQRLAVRLCPPHT